MGNQIQTIAKEHFYGSSVEHNKSGDHNSVIWYPFENHKYVDIVCIGQSFTGKSSFLASISGINIDRNKFCNYKILGRGTKVVRLWEFDIDTVDGIINMFSLFKKYDINPLCILSCHKKNISAMLFLKVYKIFYSYRIPIFHIIINNEQDNHDIISNSIALIQNVTNREEYKDINEKIYQFDDKFFLVLMDKRLNDLETLIELCQGSFPKHKKDDFKLVTEKIK